MGNESDAWGKIIDSSDNLSHLLAVLENYARLAIDRTDLSQWVGPNYVSWRDDLAEQAKERILERYAGIVQENLSDDRSLPSVVVDAMTTDVMNFATQYAGGVLKNTDAYRSSDGGDGPIGFFRDTRERFSRWNFNLFTDPEAKGLQLEETSRDNHEDEIEFDPSVVDGAVDRAQHLFGGGWGVGQDLQYPMEDSPLFRGLHLNDLNYRRHHRGPPKNAKVRLSGRRNTGVALGHQGDNASLVDGWLETQERQEAYWAKFLGLKDKLSSFLVSNSIKLPDDTVQEVAFYALDNSVGQNAAKHLLLALRTRYDLRKDFYQNLVIAFEADRHPREFLRDNGRYLTKPIR